MRVLAPPTVETPLRALWAAWEARGWDARRVSYEGLVPSEARRAEVAEEADSLLVIGDRRVAPRQALPGLVHRRADGVAVPMGWLPELDEATLRRFAETAASVHDRARAGEAQTSLALLSQWSPRYLRLAGRIETLVRARGRPVWRWSSDLLLREHMAIGLRSGLGAAIYVGHGRPIGWVGYRGTRIRHLSEPAGEPLGALLNLCCLTASRRRNGLSFAEALPLRGVAAASLGACTATLHSDNTRWAVALCEALGGAPLASGPASVGAWISASIPANEAASSAWRLLGDPSAPLADGPLAGERAGAIAVYP